jgi:hypothetical protein
MLSSTWPEAAETLNAEHSITAPDHASLQVLDHKTALLHRFLTNKWLRNEECVSMHEHCIMPI